MTEAREFTVTIPGRPPTPNARRNWGVVARENEAWDEKVRVIAQGRMADDPALWPTELERERSVGKRGKVTPELRRCTRPITYATRYVMTFVVPDHRERDWDNAVASGKPLTDALVHAGVLAGDSTRYIDPDGRRVSFRREAGKSGVEILVEEGRAPGLLNL